MNGLFIVCVLFGGLWALTHGTAETLGAELMLAGENAVELMLQLMGGMMVWCGLMKVLEKSGAVHALSRVMARPVRFLLGREAQDARVLQAVCMNFAANLLGLGNAATPAGLSAMQSMSKYAADGRPTHGMCMFLLLNASSLQLIPTTVLALRAGYGAAEPSDILLPTLAGSCAATVTAVLLGLVCRRREA